MIGFLTGSRFEGCHCLLCAFEASSDLNGKPSLSGLSESLVTQPQRLTRWPCAHFGLAKLSHTVGPREAVLLSHGEYHWGRRQGAVQTHIVRISSVHVHILPTGLTKHQFKDKITKRSKTAAGEHSMDRVSWVRAPGQLHHTCDSSHLCSLCWMGPPFP